MLIIKMIILNKRVQDQSKIVSDTHLNLEIAKLNKELFFVVLIPYFMAQSWISCPPLGSINNQNENGAPILLKINIWVYYLSTAFGTGVSPSFSVSINELFPFNF